MMKDSSRSLGRPIELRKGSEIQLSPDLHIKWVGLRERMLVEATLDEIIPNYIRWPQFNKKDGPFPKDPQIVDQMGEIIAHVFGPTKPTHIFGIMDAGEDITWSVAKHMKMNNKQVIFSRKLQGNPIEFTGPHYLARSYKSSVGQTASGQGEVYMSSYLFPPGSRVLITDDVVALLGVGGPAIRKLLSQGVKVVGFAMGLGKMHQGWSEDLKTIEPHVVAFPVVRVANIQYANGQSGVGSIILTPQRQALQLV